MHPYDAITYDGRRIQSTCDQSMNVPDDCISSTHVSDISLQDDQSFYIRVTKFDPHFVSTMGDDVPYPCAHGGLTGIGSRKFRTVVVEGVIIAKDPAGREKGIRHLHHAWRSESTPNFMHRGDFMLQWQTHETDANGKPMTLFTRAKVLNYKPKIELTKGFCGITPWSVELQCADPNICILPDPSADKTIIHEGFIGGIDLLSGEGHRMAQFSDVWNPLELMSTDIGDSCQHDARSPIRIRITVDSAWQSPQEFPPHASGYSHGVAVGSFITFAHVESGQFMQLNYDMTATDEIIIDGNSGEIFVNGVLRMDLLSPISTGFPSIGSGNNTLVLADSTHFRDHGQALIGEMEYFLVW